MEIFPLGLFSIAGSSESFKGDVSLDIFSNLVLVALALGSGVLLVEPFLRLTIGGFSKMTSVSPTPSMEINSIFLPINFSTAARKFLSQQEIMI